MKTYYFTVVFNPGVFSSFCLKAKTLKNAINTLEYCLPCKFSGEYEISRAYTLISNGKRSFRHLPKIIRGVA